MRRRGAWGQVLGGPASAMVEDTAYLIHGAIHGTLGDRARVVMHTHMPCAQPHPSLRTLPSILPPTNTALHSDLQKSKPQH